MVVTLEDADVCKVVGEVVVSVVVVDTLDRTVDSVELTKDIFDL